MRRLIRYCAALVMLVVASGALADLHGIEPVGGVLTGGSWGQAFVEQGVGYFDSVTVLWNEAVTPVSAEALEPPTFRGLPDDWSITPDTADSPVVTTATGLARDEMT
jgi:hypothetical protein